MRRALPIVVGVSAMMMRLFMRMIMLMIVVMLVSMIVCMNRRVHVLMVVPVRMIVRVSTTLDGGVSLAAAAYRTHHSTSSSLIFISSPPVTCNW